MPFHHVPLTVEVQIAGTHGADKRETVIHYRYASFVVPDAALLNSLIDGIVATVLPPYVAMLSNRTVFQSIKATDINTAGGVSVTRSITSGGTGALTDDPVPGNVNFNMKKATNVTGKHRFGEIYVPDLTEAVQGDASVTSGYLGAAINFAVALLLHQAGLAPVVASKTRADFYTITAIVFDNWVSSLITRLINHRRHKRRH